MKKLISLLLVVFMMFSLTAVAFAAEISTNTGDASGDIKTTSGSISITGIGMENDKPVATYAIYQILQLQSFSTAGTGTYDYKFFEPTYDGEGNPTPNPWTVFFTSGAGKDYIGKNEQGVLVWKGGDNTAEFAKLALKYAKANNITPTRITTNASDYTVSEDKTSISFNNLELGCYLVDSTVGALCGLSTTAPYGVINAKNGAPTLVKRVQEDLDGKWDSNSTLDIGQHAHFQVEVTVHDGAQNYLLVDEMDESLTFIDKDFRENNQPVGEDKLLKVYVRDGGTSALTEIDTTLTIKDAQGNDKTINTYTLTVDDDKHGFTVEFTQDFCDTLNTNDRLIVEYYAMLNRYAEIGNSTAEVLHNKNTAYLGYGDEVSQQVKAVGRAHSTAVSTVTVTTYGFDLAKTDGQNKLLDGAQFKIYDAANGGTEIKVVTLTHWDETQNQEVPVTYTVNGNTYNMYRKARVDETGEAIVVKDGLVRVVGLDNGVYYLEETKNPNGYTPLAARQSFSISNDNVYATIDANSIVSVGSGVHVVNHAGTILPETGGLGTLLFTVLGGSTVLGSGVVLVTKKRMSKIVDED